MTEKRLSMSLDMVRTIAGLSHIMSWGELQVYTLLLHERDAVTQKVRMNQTEIAKAVGYDTSVTKDFIAKLKEMDLIRKWRSQPGNYYELVLPLPEKVIDTVREHIPSFGRELEWSARRKRKKGLAQDSSNDALISSEIQEDVSLEDDPPKNEEPHDPREVSDAPERVSSEEVAPETMMDAPSPEEPALDPQISRLLDTLEQGTVRNGTCRFLESLGFLDPQLGLDQKIVVDRPGLLRYLLKCDANTVEKFCELAKDFQDGSQNRIPYIDVPFAYPITLRIHHKLDLYLCGMKWLRETIRVRNEDGILLSDLEVRQNLYGFMVEHGLRTFDDVIALAKVKHQEIASSKGSNTTLSPEAFGLGSFIQ